MVTFVRGALVGWYPYFFLDVTARGLAQALVNSLLVVVFGLALIGLFVVVDRFAPVALGLDGGRPALEPRRPGSAPTDRH